MNAKTHDSFIRCCTHLRGTLRDATSQTPRDLERELIVLWVEANEWYNRAPLMYEPVTLDQVRDCDRMAAGHVDWSSKLPLYVAEIVYGVGA